MKGAGGADGGEGGEGDVAKGAAVRKRQLATEQEMKAHCTALSMGHARAEEDWA